jgi:beta-glucosidase
MTKILKILGYSATGIAAVLILVIVLMQIRWSIKSSNNLSLLGEEAPLIESDGFQFRDLNKNGKLDIYEDVRKSTEERVEDLINQMILEEKAGSMFITMIGMNDDGSILEKPIPSEPITMMLPSTSDMIARRLMNHFNTVQGFDAKIMASWNNNVQKIAEKTRLGIPVTIATDPRHSAGKNPGANIYTKAFSTWPSSLGLAATRDTVLVREFGDIARQEYLSVGIRLGLHPMADLATEPRWGRINGTFGEDAELSAMMTKAYILGFQGEEMGKHSVAMMTKHFSGGGPQRDGEDAHFPYGKEQVYPGNNFDYHLIPFKKGAFPAGTASIMPYYGIPVGQTDEDVAFGFNKQIITDMLRGKYGFDGVVCTDWNIISDGMIGEGRAWGVEHLSTLERARKVIDAGCDMYGGEASPEWIVELVNSGQIREARIDESVRRIMKDKFRMGLFDDPYLDVDNANKVAGNSEFRAKGNEAQRKAMVLLKNEKNALPLPKGKKLYIENIDKEIAVEYGDVVSSVEEADYVLIRVNSPYSQRDEYFLEQFFHQGRLYFTQEELDPILSKINSKPGIIGINLERPALLSEIAEASTGLLADFGADDEAFLDIVFGVAEPQGKLPFELPSTQETVEKQLEDVPYDSENPLFPFGYGLGYTKPSL